MSLIEQEKSPPSALLFSYPVLPGSRPADLNFCDADYRILETGVESRFGVRLSEYKSDQMRRRLQTLAEKHGCRSFASFLSGIQSRPDLLHAFLDTMTINVTELLRNPERFGELVQWVLPELRARRSTPPLSAWSAGCSYGAEAYTLALLLHELEPTGTHRIRGTDVDLAVLAKANGACFTEQDMTNLSPARRLAHFQDLAGASGADGPLTPRYRPQTHLRGKVTFRRHDLLTDPYPKAEYDLILCRNVLIYFTDVAKERIYRGFFQALRPGGVLFVGGTERLANHVAVGFELIRPFFYRRPVG